MTATPDEQPRALNCVAIRTLHELQRKLGRQINDLMAIECEDAEAADALVFAIESAERALDKAREVRRRLLRGESPADRPTLRAAPVG